MTSEPNKIYIAGHRGMVGSAIARQLLTAGHAAENLITRTHAELDLTDQAAVRAFFQAARPTQVYLAAAMASASVYVMNLPKATHDQHTTPMQSHINVGYGSDISIAELAQTVGQVVGYQGTIDFDTSKLDGAPRKLMNSSRIKALGWKAETALAHGLRSAYQYFVEHQNLNGN